MTYRQAIVVIHGMGEQKPLDTLKGFVGAVLSQYQEENQRYYSRPARVTDSYEARRFIIPPIYDTSPDRRPQIEVFEYHWSHLMQGNRLDDLAGTVRRILFRLPWQVPAGIFGLWLVLWLLILLGGLAIYSAVRAGQLTEFPSVADTLGIVVGTSALGSTLTFAVTRLFPGWLTGSFVDVVRYLDTSPRSYAVRRDIREGAVRLLTELNEKYDRVVIVAHSLGSYIAYDAIRYLWGQHNRDYAKPVNPTPKSPRVPAGLDEVEAAAIAIEKRDASGDDLTTYQKAQRTLWDGLRDEGHWWRISDLITLGSPMYMADKIYTRNRKTFRERVDHHEFPTCPPQEDSPSWRSSREPPRQRRYTYVSDGRRVLYDAAPFAIIRWTNFWFTTRALFFGDWFGGSLRELFGPGIRDVPITSGSRRRLLPGYAHSLYFKLIAEEPRAQLGEAFHEALRRKPRSS